MSKHAALTRMVLPDHTCPFGVQAREMLDEAGYEIDERILSTRDEVETYKREAGVETTPQIEIDGRRIGGSEALAAFLQQGTA